MGEELSGCTHNGLQHVIILAEAFLQEFVGVFEKLAVSQVSGAHGHRSPTAQ